MSHLHGDARVSAADHDTSPRSGTRTAARRRLVGVAAAGIVLALVGCSSSPSPSAGRTVIDVLQQDWRHVSGIVAADDVLRVTATGRTIVEQDGSGGQPDPPLNLAGTHLSAPDDFTLNTTFTDVTADATLTLSDSPPVIADEFRIEPAGVRLTLRGDDLRIAVFDGSDQQDVTDPQPTRDEHVTVADPEAELSVERTGDQLAVASGGRTLATLPVAEVFDSGALWLGLSSDAGSFTVRSLIAEAPAGSSLATAGPVAADAEPASDGLQARAERIRPDFLVGAAVALGPLASDAQYAEHFVGQFGALTPENAMKPQALSPRQGEYRFAEADAIVDLAQRKGIAVHGHTIAFTEAMPRWMRNLPTGTKQQRAASAEVLLDYVTTVVTHFRGKLDSLDVVNEPFDVDQGTSLQRNVWYRVFGSTYPVVVSRAVQAADPDVRQFINENGADVPGPRQDALLQLANDTNDRGGYIDGVGLQSHVYHLDTDAISADDLETALDNVEDAGLIARISENDVTDDEGQEAQAEQYATVLETCLHSEACVSYTTWGVDDRYDWWVDDDGSLQQGHDFVYNDGEPTPAYHALRRVVTDWRVVCEA